MSKPRDVLACLKTWIQHRPTLLNKTLLPDKCLSAINARRGQKVKKCLKSA